MEDTDQITAPYRRPTPDRPLLGLTVLVVEDSRYASESLRLMCLHSGARIRRADCLASARRHLKVYRPSAAIVDLGLPDGSGLGLIRDMAAARPRIGVILATSGDDTTGPSARAAGADDFLAKPLDSLATFQHAILSHLPPDRQPRGVRPVRNDRVVPDPIALRDDLAHAADVLAQHPDRQTIGYVAHFLQGIAHSTGDTTLAEVASDLTTPGGDPQKIARRLQELAQNGRAI